MAQDKDSQTRTVTGGGGGFTFLHHIEMRVKSRHLIDFRQSQFHLVSQRGEMGGGEVTVSVLDQMQMLDQQIASPGTVSKQRPYVINGVEVYLPALGRSAGPLALAVTLRLGSREWRLCIHSSHI